MLKVHKSDGTSLLYNSVSQSLYLDIIFERCSEIWFAKKKFEVWSTACFVTKSDATSSTAWWLKMNKWIKDFYLSRLDIFIRSDNTDLNLYFIIYLLPFFLFSYHNFLSFVERKFLLKHLKFVTSSTETGCEVKIFFCWSRRQNSSRKTYLNRLNA